MNIENLIKLSDETPADYHFEVYKRIADTCLFLLGLFPEYVMYDYYWLFSHSKFPARRELTRTIGDYEMLGQKFYELASKDERAATNNLDRVLELLSKKLYLAKKPLNYVSGHFIELTKSTIKKER